MKKIILVTVVGMLQFALLPTVEAQYFGARRYVRPIAPQVQPPPARPAQVAPSGQPVVVPAAPPAQPAAPVDPAKAKADREAAAKRTAESLKKQAEAGSASAQFQLAIRYLKGDGVQTNVDEARRWLREATKNGHSLAPKKLEELEQQPVEPRPSAEQPTPAASSNH